MSLSIQSPPAPQVWQYESGCLRYDVTHAFTARLTSARRFKYRVGWRLVSPVSSSSGGSQQQQQQLK